MIDVSSQLGSKTTRAIHSATTPRTILGPVSNNSKQRFDVLTCLSAAGDAPTVYVSPNESQPYGWTLVQSPRAGLAESVQLSLADAGFCGPQGAA
jgi:hypothetical protein